MAHRLTTIIPFLTAAALTLPSAAQLQPQEQPEAEPGVLAQPERQPGNRGLPAQDRGQPGTGEARDAGGEEMVSFGIFAEPIELTTLIDYVGSTLNINIVIKGTPEGEIVFNAPVRVPKNKLIDLLDAMLEQYGYTITYDAASSFYIVQELSDVKPVFGDTLASTRIIPTPNIKPSLLVEPLRATLFGPGQGGGGGGQTDAIQAVDELGVLIINAPARDIRRLSEMVEALIEIDRSQEFIRFELEHVAAPIALDRVIGLSGGGQGGGTISAVQRRGGNQNQPGASVTMGISGGLTNIGERTTVDPQGNALIFKGTRNEIERVGQLLEVIDVPNTLEPRNYFAGASAAQIADIAKRRGLGEVILIEAQNQALNQFNRFGGQQQQQLGQSDFPSGEGGPVMVVDQSRGNIVYYGTAEQQAQLANLLTELRTEDERVVIREYVLNHTDALTITDLLIGIITGESQTGESDLLPGGTGRGNQNFNPNFGFNIEGETGAFDPDRIAVIADEFSNQVIVKAPIKQQDDLAALIDRLDKQRPQVYIQAMIVSVADNEDLTLAFETQLVRGDFAAGTNFGLSSRDNFTDAKSVAAGLGGLTSAIIRSDYIPLIINATQTNTDIKILSTPQLLVNDNQESEIVSVSEQPFTEVSQADEGGNNLVGFGGFEEAGTTLRVTPSISDGGFLRLEYFVELSNFTAASGTDGSPPPRDTNTLEGSITVPSNATVVLGGITVDDVRNTIIKVPLIGDIPLLGELFKRRSEVNNRTRLYVFLTPRIMSDPNFTDLRLFTEGPQNQIGIESDLPEMEPAIIGVPSATRLPAAQEAQEDNAVVVPELEPAYIEAPEPEGTE